LSVARDYKKLFGEAFTYQEGVKTLEDLKTAETGFKFDMKNVRGGKGRRPVRMGQGARSTGRQEGQVGGTIDLRWSLAGVPISAVADY
jgi:hypothetical protein